MKTFTDDGLKAMLARKYKGEVSGLVHSLVSQLLSERALNKTALDQMIRQRLRVLEAEHGCNSFPRVLIVDSPPLRTDMRNCHGELQIFSDFRADVRFVQIEANPADQRYDEVLDEALTRYPESFKQLPYELSSRTKASYTRWIRNDEPKSEDQPQTATGGTPW